MARHLIAVAAAAAVSFGCGDATFDLRDGAIEAAVAGALDLDGDGVEVVCPGSETLDPERGGELRCTADAEGASALTLEIDVVVAPAAGGAISVDVEVVTALFDVAAASVVVAERLDADLGGDPVVRCDPTPRVVLEVGRRIGCVVTATGGTAGPVERALTIVIIDEDGDFEVDVAPP